MIRAVAEGFPSSRRRRSSGYSGVSSSKCGRARPGGIPLTVFHPEQRPELAARRSAGLRAGRALDQVALPEPVLPDLRGGDIYIVRAATVAGGADEGVAVGQVDEARHRDGGLGRFNLSPGR